MVILFEDGTHSPLRHAKDLANLRRGLAGRLIDNINIDKKDGLVFTKYQLLKYSIFIEIFQNLVSHLFIS